MLATETNSDTPVEAELSVGRTVDARHMHMMVPTDDHLEQEVVPVDTNVRAWSAIFV